jgi:hypothetical protein
MKPIIPFALLGALFAVGAANAASTDPVGYITHSVNASGETYVSPTLVQPTVFAAASSADPSGTTTISFSGGVPTGLDGSYVLEITAGNSEGFWSTVVSSTSTSITVTDTLPSGLGSAVSIAVRKHATVGSFLGLNAPGLVDYDGEQANDEVQLLDPVTQGTGAIAWVSGPNLADPNYPNGAWFDLVLSEVANDYVIEPGTAIRIKRVGGATTFVSSGAVKVTDTQVDIFQNFNWIGTPLATGGTLNGMNFNSQLVKYDGESATYDELQFLRPSQGTDPFAAIDDGNGGSTMFDLVLSEDAGLEPFPEGTGVIINRVNSPAGSIVIPGSVVAQP